MVLQLASLLPGCALSRYLQAISQTIARFFLPFTLFGVISCAFFSLRCDALQQLSLSDTFHPHHVRKSIPICSLASVSRDTPPVSPSILTRTPDEFLDAFDLKLGVLRTVSVNYHFGALFSRFGMIFCNARIEHVLLGFMQLFL